MELSRRRGSEKGSQKEFLEGVLRREAFEGHRRQKHAFSETTTPLRVCPFFQGK